MDLPKNDFEYMEEALGKNNSLFNEINRNGIVG